MPRKPSSASKRSKSERRVRPPSASILPAFFLFILAGCAGYQLGPTNTLPAGSRSVQINLFRNDTWEPRLTEAVGTALRRSVQRDGTFRLATRRNGDIVVDGVITEFDRSGLTFQPADILTVRDYQLTMRAKVTAVERGTGLVLIDSIIDGRTTIRSGADLSSAERQAVPLMAEDLARNVTSLLADGRW